MLDSNPARRPSSLEEADHADQLAINTIRTLTIDAVERAKSGHTGMPMGMAPVAYTLWTRFLNYDPASPHWPGRDRFVLSAGHGSMLLYALLHLADVIGVGADGKPTGRPAVSLDDIKAFRQLDSVTPGHPEYGHTTGVEATTGPLGQGVANSVGMAIAARWFAARYDRADSRLFGYNVYALCSDGDLMEGISGEAASIAGHLKLSNLCWIYDDNHVTIEGPTGLAFSEDVARRFEGYGWATYTVADANETAEAWRVILSQSVRPAAIALSRQTLPVLDRARLAPASGLARGGYVLADCEPPIALILIACGGEVAMCLEARERLAGEGVRCRLVSMPSFDLFEAQDEAWRRSVLPPEVGARLAVEAASPLGWDRYAGPAGEIIAMRRFGASAPYPDLRKRFGFTADAIVEAARRLLGKPAGG
jgi:transketolase